MKKRKELLILLLTMLTTLNTVQAQTVVTDTRMARGATMAFGRMTTKGFPASQIAEQGFCWATHNNPTVDDQTTTKYLTNSGRIYWLEGLTPATLYYMRAYVKQTDGQVFYGDALKFYTIPKGQITYTMRSDGPEAVRTRIENATKKAIDYWNNLTEMRGFSPNVGYDAGVQTADCSYGGWIRVGPNTSYQAAGTIMHEMLHGVGVIPWADTEWSRHTLRSGVTSDGYGTGYWLGDRVTEVLRFWDNSATAQLNGDYQHLWPYGINGASEDKGTDLLYIGNSLIIQALGEDGLQHTYEQFAQPYYAFNQEDTIKYYIKSESERHGLLSCYLVPTASGLLKWQPMSARQAAANDSAAWYVTFTPKNQYYQFRNAATGRYLSFQQNGSNGIRTAKHDAPTANDNFHLMKSRKDVAMGDKTLDKRGYWIIHPTTNWTPPCLEADDNGNITAKTFDIADDAITQRWLLLTADETRSLESMAMTDMKADIQKQLELVKSLAAVPHTENVSGVDDALNASIASVEARMEAATAVDELLPLTDEVLLAGMDFLKNATPSNVAQPFDLTYLLANPGIDDESGWSATPSISYASGEFFQQPFDMYQTLTGLPAGTYAFCAQAFQRPGKPAECSKNDVTANIYLNDVTQPVAHAISGAQSRRLGGNETIVNGKVIPNNMQAASIYFSKGIYENSVVGTTVDGQLKLGIESQSMGSYYWVVIDNCRLYYYGSRPVSEVTAVEAIVEREPATVNAVYDLQGRRIHLTPHPHHPTIYIINGKKVVIR